MKYYFDLFDNENNHNYIIYEEQQFLKTNKPFFTLRFAVSELIRENFEVCNLIIEKEVNGNYIFNNKVSGVINNDNISFKNIEFKNIVEPEEKYRIYFEVKVGGIVTFTSKNKPINFILNTKPFDFDIILDNSILLNDIYELQGDNINEINFSVITKKGKTFKYYYSISPKENISPSSFLPLEENKVFNTTINGNLFKNNITFLHFFTKDSFDNVKYKKIKITTKNNSLSILSIINNEIQIKSLDEEIGIFFESRNVSKITPIIKFNSKDGEVVKKGKVKGFSNKDSINFNLKEEFGEINSNNIFLFFLLNEDDNLNSNYALINIDNEKPVITLPEYTIITDKYKNKANIKGKIIDSNFFYLGENINTLKPKKKLLLIKSELELSKVSFGTVEKKLMKFSDYYYTESLGKSFDVLNKENEIVRDYSFLNSFEENKHFYIWLNKEKLTLFEKNIIENQGILKLKGDIEKNIINQEHFIFENIIVLKVVIANNTPEKISFDIGIDGFEYSFLKYINNSNISCELNNKKEIITDFVQTNTIISKSKISEVVKFNKIKKISKKIGVYNNFINFSAISFKDEEFAFKGNILFLDEELNTKKLKDIYFIPTLEKNEEIIEINNDEKIIYSCKKISDKIYNFEIDIPIEDGINKFNLKFVDSLNNEVKVPFEVEKNFNLVHAIIENERNLNFNIYSKDEKISLTTREEEIVLDLKIINETKKSKESDKKIILKGNDIVKEDILKPNNNERKISFSLKATNEETHYEVFYDNDLEPIMKFSIIKKNELFLNVKERIVTGFTEYLLPVKKDDFSKLSVNFSNPSFNIDILDNKIKIIRNNNIQITEELILEINVFDENGIFQSVSKNVSILFYNDNVIENYEIVNFKNHHINKNTFDVKFNINNLENIEYFRLIDPFELNFRKKFKYALLNSEEFIISGITTPLKESTFFVEFKIKDSDLIIKKELFKDNPVSYYDEGKNFKVSIYKENDLIVEIISESKENTAFFYVGDKEIGSEKLLIKQNFFRFENLFDDEEFVAVKIINNENKLVYFYKELINFNSREKEKIETDLNDYFNIKTISELSNFKVSGLKENYNYFIKTTDEFLNESIFEINNGFNNLSLKEGIYILEIYKQKNKNKIEVLSKVILEIVKNKKDYLIYSKEYSNFDKINFIEFKNLSIIPFTKLNPYLEHITENKIVKIYPMYLDEKTIQFDFNKQLGLNEFRYVDSIQDFELESFRLDKKPKDEKVQIFNVNTEEYELFYKDENDEIILEDKANVYFKVFNCDNIIIKPIHINNEIKRVVFNKMPVIIYKEFIPCKLEFYKNDILKKTINIKISENNNTKIPINTHQNKELKDLFSFKIKKYKYEKQEIKLLMKNRNKHFLLQYTLFTAKMLGVKNFINDFTLEEQEEFIKNVSSDIYNKTKTMDLDLIKSEIKNRLKKLGGING